MKQLARGHGTNEASAKALPEVQSLFVHAIAGVRTPGQNAEIQSDKVVQQARVAVRSGHTRLNEHPAYGTGSRCLQAMHQTPHQRLLLFRHQAQKAAQGSVARAVQQSGERCPGSLIAGARVVQHHALLVARHGFEAHLGEILLDGRHSVQGQHHRVAYFGGGMALRGKDVACHFGQMDHAAGMVAAFLFVAVKQAAAGLSLDDHGQLPGEIAGIAHAAVVALALPDRHDVRGIACQQDSSDPKLRRQSCVVRIHALADVVDLVWICDDLAHQLGKILRL